MAIATSHAEHIRVGKRLYVGSEQAVEKRHERRQDKAKCDAKAELIYDK